LTNVRPDGNPRPSRLIWLLLILSAALAVYFGLSSLLLPFVGEPDLYPGIERWIVLATGALQLAAAGAAFVMVSQRDLRGAVLAVAACLMLGWLGALPGMVRTGLDFGGAARAESVAFVALPVIASAAAALAWRNPHPVLAAFVVTAPASAGMAFVVVFAVVIAVHGF
jgi:hypothetical protein